MFKNIILIIFLPVTEFKLLNDNPVLNVIDAHILQYGDHDLPILWDALLLLHLLLTLHCCHLNSFL